MSVDRTMITVNGNRKRNVGLVKLFVGQIPSTMDETALNAFLSDYVPILRVEILYDRNSNLHRNCAFAYVESVDDAKTLIQSLNGQFTFNGMRSPVHIDYAYRRGRRGHSDRQSRYSSSPILENRRQKARSRKENCSCETCDEILNSNSMPPLVKPLSRQSFDSSKNPSQGEKSRENSPSRFFDSNSSQYTLQSTQSTCQRELLSSASSDHPKTPAPVLQIASSTPPISDDGTLLNYSPQAFYYSPIFYTLPTANVADSNQQTVSPPPYPNLMPFPGVSSSPGLYYPVIVPEQILPLPVSSSTAVPTMTGIKTVSDVSGFHEEGPVGANVFVYHIPSSMDDEGLRAIFSPFGTILSTKVYLDNETKESRGFGFVSFSTVDEAEKAIREMNGYVIEGKHLKVQKKKEKYQNPYSYPLFPYSGF